MLRRGDDAIIAAIYGLCMTTEVRSDQRATMAGLAVGALAGDSGTGVAIGQGIQVIGVVTALIAGVVASRATYRQPSRHGRGVWSER